MKQYLDLMQHVLDHGVKKEDRTGTGTLSVFGAQMRFDLAEGFPLVTTKKVHLKSIIHELIWFLKGTGDVTYLREHGIKIWEEWTKLDGTIGPGYGHQWRHWDDYAGIYTDQITAVINQIKISPDSRRMLVSAWNVNELHHMALPPCHYAFQFYVLEGRLSCMFHMRSSDVLLGLPFNIASYALLTMMVAQVTGLQPGELIWTGGDVHLYLNHLEQAREQLSREPRPLPTMTLNPAITDIDDFTYEDFSLSGYDPHPKIKAPVAV